MFLKKASRADQKVWTVLSSSGATPALGKLGDRTLLVAAPRTEPSGALDELLPFLLLPPLLLPPPVLLLVTVPLILPVGETILVESEERVPVTSEA